jgi:hypothetical protein
MLMLALIFIIGALSGALIILLMLVNGCFDAERKRYI